MTWPIVVASPGCGQVPPDQLAASGAAAQLAIEGYLDRCLCHVEGDVVTIDGTGTEAVLLDEWPVENVHEVKLCGRPFHCWTWSREGVLMRTDGCPWPSLPRSIELTYDHGYKRLPPRLHSIFQAVAARALGAGGSLTNGSGASLTGVRTQSQTLGKHSVTFTDGTESLVDASRLSSISPTLTAAEMDSIDQFARTHRHAVA